MSGRAVSDFHHVRFVSALRIREGRGTRVQGAGRWPPGISACCCWAASTRPTHGHALAHAPSHTNRHAHTTAAANQDLSAGEEGAAEEAGSLRNVTQDMQRALGALGTQEVCACVRTCVRACVRVSLTGALVAAARCQADLQPGDRCCPALQPRLRL